MNSDNRPIGEKALRSAAVKMTVDDIQTALRMVARLVDGCGFVNSRRFKPGLSCGEDTGHGWDCNSCEARAFLKKVLG